MFDALFGNAELIPDWFTRQQQMTAAQQPRPDQQGVTAHLTEADVRRIVRDEMARAAHNTAPVQD